MSLEQNLYLNNGSTRLEMIEYPGMVKNVNKMLCTLGGITNISQSLGAEEKRLELRFHPDNPYNNGILSEKGQRFGLLLSIKVRRKKKKQNTKPLKYDVNIVGYCMQSFGFENLCDFQYLPLGKERSEISLLQSLVPQSITQTDYFVRCDMPLFCCPQQFARADTVNLSNLRNTNFTEDGQHDVLGVLQRYSYDNRQNIIFNMIDVFPTQPDVNTMKHMKIKYVSDEQLQVVKKLFEKCPIWTRVALLYESGLTNDKLKYIIPSLAYYFSTGPWRTLYIRYGHDPRRDFNSRYYQTFDYRLRFRSGMATFVANRRDSGKKKHANPFEQEGPLKQDFDYPYLDQVKLPRCRQCILRYCDIRIPRVQEMLDKIPTPLTGAVCNERTGWLPIGFDSQVRQVVNSSIKDLLCNFFKKHSVNSSHTDDMEDVDDDEDGEYADDNEELSELSENNDEIFNL